MLFCQIELLYKRESKLHCFDCFSIQSMNWQVRSARTSRRDQVDIVYALLLGPLLEP